MSNNNITVRSTSSSEGGRARLGKVRYDTVLLGKEEIIV